MRSIPLLALLIPFGVNAAEMPEDPHLWLEDVEGRRRPWTGSAVTTTWRMERADGKDPELRGQMRTRLLAILRLGRAHPVHHQARRLVLQLLAGRGASPRSVAADHPGVVEVRRHRVGGPDRSGQARRRTKDENWVWHGSTCLRPEYDPVPDQPVPRRSRCRCDPRVRHARPGRLRSRVGSSAPRPRAACGGSIGTRSTSPPTSARAR